MKLEKYALIAEIIGGFAIVVTLIILVFEMRGNTEEIRAATLANIAARTQEFALLSIRNPHMADIEYRLSTGAELSPTEIELVGGVVIALLKLGEESFIAYRDGRLEEEIWGTRGAVVLNLLDDELERDLYVEFREGGVLIKGFTDWLDAELIERYGE